MSAHLDIADMTVLRGGRRVVDGVSMRLESGRITALLGPNGAGKSSLVLALAGALPIASGTVAIDGIRLDPREPYQIRRAGIAAVPEGHQVLTRLTVDENLKVAAAIHEPARGNRLIDDAFGVFPELKPLRRRLAGGLSGGEAQMLALAQAIVSAPKFLLADEMSLGLAPIVVQRLMLAIGPMAAAGIGVLLIEQFTHVALKLAGRVYVMDRGRIRFDGTPADLRLSPNLLHETYLTAEMGASGPPLASRPGG